MNRVRLTIAAALLALAMSALVAPGAAFAQQEQAERNSPFGLGFQSSWPAYGISGLYDVNETVTAQAVLGAFGSWTTVSGRLLYHFQREAAYSLFGVGAVGLWRYSFGPSGSRATENSVMVGGGAGIELNWRQILGEGGTSFPPLYTNIDLTLTFASFDAYNWNAFGFGAGLHYRF